MNSREAIRLNLDMSRFVGLTYLGDLTQDQMMQRPHPEMNHLTWQVGHLIESENRFVEMMKPGASPKLPDGFVARYAKEAATSDDPAEFDSKETLLALFEAQREATLKALDSMSEADMDHETGVDYAPTFGSMFSLLGSHWMMHAGQWAVVRRQHGKPVVI